VTCETRRHPVVEFAEVVPVVRIEPFIRLAFLSRPIGLARKPFVLSGKQDAHQVVEGIAVLLAGFGDFHGF
jgi:hypothetical protein